MNKLYLSSLALLALIAAGIFGFYQFQSQTTPVPAKVEKLSLGIVTDSSALALIADKLGYFEQNGIDLQLSNYTTGSVAMQDMLEGKIDLAVAAGFVGVAHAFQTDNFKIVASIAKAEAFEILARTDHGIRVPSDIIGKKIGITRGTAGEFWLSEFLLSNQIDLSSIQVVDMRPAQLTDAFIKGDIDAVLNLEPHVYNAKSALPGKTVSWRGRSGQGVYSVVYANAETVSHRPALLQKFIRSVVQAEAYMTDYTEESLGYIGEYFGHDQAYLDNVLAAKLDFYVALEQALILTMEDIARWMVGGGQTDARQIPNFLNFIFFPPLEAVKPEAVTIIK